MTEMTSSNFYESLAFPDYKDWKREPHSIRKAFHVAVSAFHLADHYCRFHQRTHVGFQQRYGKNWDAVRNPGLTDFHLALEKRQPSFNLIHSMATAYKHLYTSGTWCEVLSGGDIYVLKYKNLNIQHGDDDVIMIRRKGGSTARFDKAIAGVMTMWGEIIQGDDPCSV